VKNADKVIVQSEEMKRIYVELLTKHTGEHTRSVWEEKILGLGSPKLDKVNNSSMADFEIPEEWKPVLYNADGSRRKTILYNTTVTALVQHGEKMLAKMRSVFETFYENREEIALLWRPHPLIKATIESMAPELWVEYEKVVNDFDELTKYNQKHKESVENAYAKNPRRNRGIDATNEDIISTEAKQFEEPKSLEEELAELENL